MTDQTAAPRPVPTFADRTATDAPLPTWLPDALEELRAERVKTGRLEGEHRNLVRNLHEALAERDQAEEDDLRSPLAAERDKLVETIGRLVSLPPEQIAKMHKVGYSGSSADLGCPSPRAQDEPGRRSETGCMGDPDTELRLAGVHPDQEAARALALAYTALNADDKMCRYHGTDFERLGMERGEPRCDSCKQPWRVNRALDAIEAAEATP